MTASNACCRMFSTVCVRPRWMSLGVRSAEPEPHSAISEIALGQVLVFLGSALWGLLAWVGQRRRLRLTN